MGGDYWLRHIRCHLLGVSPVSYTHLSFLSRLFVSRECTVLQNRFLYNANQRPGFRLGPVSYTHLKAYTVSLAGCRIEDCYVGNLNSGFFFNDATRWVQGRNRLLMFLNQVDTFNNDLAGRQDIDVYKRQALPRVWPKPRSKGSRVTLACVELTCSISTRRGFRTVSYTHLDVYKRQVLHQSNAHYGQVMQKLV